MHYVAHRRVRESNAKAFTVNSYIDENFNYIVVMLCT